MNQRLLSLKETEERVIEYIFIIAIALIILSVTFFIFKITLGHYNLHLALLNNNLPFVIHRSSSWLVIILLAPVLVICLLFCIIKSKEKGGLLPENGFKASSLLFLVEFLIISISYYVNPSAASTTNGFNNIDYALYYSVWTIYLGIVSLLPPLVTLIFLNLYGRIGTRSKLFSKALNIRQSFIISIPIALISDIVWSNSLVQGLQYYLLFYAVSILFISKGPIIGAFAALFPIELDIIAYSFFGVLEIPFIFLTFILILAGFLQLFFIFPSHHENLDETKQDKRDGKSEADNKIKREEQSWLKGKCPVCGHSSFLLKGGQSENLVCQNCGYEFTKF